MFHADEKLNWMQHIRLTETEIIGIIYKANPYLNCKSMVFVFWFIQICLNYDNTEWTAIVKINLKNGKTNKSRLLDLF